MALLNERQEKAAALAREIGKIDGVWVTSPLPLDDHAKLRLQIREIDRNHVVQMLKDWGWDPVFLSVLPRICTTGLIAAGIWEIDIPKPRQDVVDDRTIPPRPRHGIYNLCAAIQPALHGHSSLRSAGQIHVRRPAQ